MSWQSWIDKAGISFGLAWPILNPSARTHARTHTKYMEEDKKYTVSYMTILRYILQLD